MNNAKFILLTSLALGFSTLQAQEAIIPAGGDAAGSGGTSSYTLGQMAFEMVSGSSGTLLPGVQQPFEISIIQSIENSTNYSLTSNVYPNPVNNLLQLKIENESMVGLSFTLLDLNGKQLAHQKIEQNITAIDMSSYAPAIYILKIVNNNKETITYKIAKN